MTNRFDTWWGEFILNPAEGITREAKEVFTRGQCHSLAVAIHDMTGWPLFAVGGVPTSPHHVFVKAPKGFLDVKGHEAEKPYCYAEPIPVTREDIFDFKSYKPCDPTNAKPFADIVLEKYNALGA